MPEVRRETDSLGVVEVPADKLWGAQTQRSLEHFSIGQDLIPREMITAYATLKKATANANRAGGRLGGSVHNVAAPAGAEMDRVASTTREIEDITAGRLAPGRCQENHRRNLAIPAAADRSFCARGRRRCRGIGGDLRRPAHLGCHTDQPIYRGKPTRWARL
jgi:hypothetical protein